MLTDHSSESGDAGGSENPGVGGSIPSQPTISFSILTPSSAALTDPMILSRPADFARYFADSQRDHHRVEAALGLEQAIGSSTSPGGRLGGVPGDLSGQGRSG